jgi:Fic family protein
MTTAFLPSYRITEMLLARIAEAEALRAKIQAAPVQVAWLEGIRLDALVRRAHFSTAIEGNPLTLPEVQALAEVTRVPAAPRARREVINYLATLRWVAGRPVQGRITEGGVLRVHRLLMSGLLPKIQVGAYKTTANVIMSAGRVVFRPPGPSAAQPGTRRLVDWLNGTGMTTHPIVAAACAHYEITRLHPFHDGNGRAARVLATWVLYQRGFDTQHLFAVDQYYKEDHEGYYQALQRVHTEDEQLTSWLEYVALAVLDTLKRTLRRVEQLSLPPTVKGLSFTPKQEQLVLGLQDGRGASVQDLERLLKVKREHVYRILRPLVAQGVLTKSVTRPVVYRLAKGKP